MRTDVKLPIPRKMLSDWLSIERNETNGYQHLLLRQTSPGKWKELIDKLIQYFENAHLDARTHFHRMAGIDLHPASNKTNTVQYPNNLPDITQRGLFGEVLCGLITESFRFIGSYGWKVPVFLFRYHQDVENYIHRRLRGGNEREVIGRLGDDFLALAINDDGTVAATLVGEAKFRKTLPPSKGIELMEDVHKKMSQDDDTPVNIMRLSELLKYKDADKYAVTCADLERLNLLDTTKKVPRIDLVCLIVEKTKKEFPPTYIPQKSKHSQYTCKRELQAVEVIIEDVCDLIEEIYKQVYTNGGES